MIRLFNYQKNRRKLGHIDSTRKKKLEAKKNKERTKILNETKGLIKKEKEKVIEKELEEIESKHTDVSKCFEALLLLKGKKPKKKLMVYNGNGDMVNTKKQTDEITNFFRKIFEKDDQRNSIETPLQHEKVLHKRRD